MSPMSESLMPVGVEGFTCCVGIFEMMKGGYVKVAKDKKIGIYKITNTINNKVYIGQSKDFSKRFREHKATLKTNTHFNIHLQRAYNKYGINSFTYETLEECSEDIINERESYWIESYNSMDRFHGYNIDYGGNKDVMSDEHKLNMSIARNGTYEIDAIDVKITYPEIQEILKYKDRNTKLLLYAMLITNKRYSDNMDEFYMPYKYMTEVTGIKSRTTLIKIINDLEILKSITVIRSNGTNKYIINFLSFRTENNDKYFYICTKNCKNCFDICLCGMFTNKELKIILTDWEYRGVIKSNNSCNNLTAINNYLVD